MAEYAGTIIRVSNDSIRPIYTPALFEWEELENGNHEPVDYGAAFDTYEAQFSVIGKMQHIDDLVNAMEANRQSATWFETNLFIGIEEVFGPDIQALTVTVMEYPERVRESFGSYSLMDIKLRALTLNIVGTADFTKLRLADIHYVADTSFDIPKKFSINPAFVNYMDHRADQGVFSATFQGTGLEFSKARRYYAQTARGGVITFPNIQGITYPWGPKGPSAGGNCRIREWSNERKVGLQWQWDMTFVREY